MDFKVILPRVRSTKNCYVYSASPTDSTPNIPSLYIRKYAFKEGEAPTAVEVEVRGVCDKS